MAQEETPSLVALTGALFSTAAVAALGTAVVAASRGHEGGFGVRMVLVAAALTLPALLLAAMTRLVGATLGPARVRSVALALLLSGAVGFVAAAAVGRVLRATTHHAGLGGVTFAVLIVVALLFVLPLSLRLVGSVDAWKRKRQTALLLVTALGALGALSLAAVRVHQALAFSGLSPLASATVDGSLLLALTLALSALGLGRVRALSLAGPPLFVGLAFAGVMMVRSFPEAGQAIGEYAVLAARSGAWLLR